MREEKPSDKPLHPFLADSRQFVKIHKPIRTQTKINRAFPTPESKSPPNKEQKNRWWETFWD